MNLNTNVSYSNQVVHTSIYNNYDVTLNLNFENIWDKNLAIFGNDLSN